MVPPGGLFYSSDLLYLRDSGSRQEFEKVDVYFISLIFHAVVLLGSIN